MIDPSITAYLTKTSLQLWIDWYRKKPKLTLTLTFVGLVLSIVLVITIVTIVQIRQEAERQKNFNYAQQLQMLNDTQTNLKSLTEFIESEKIKLEESRKILSKLKEEEELLKPVIEGDRRTVDSILQIQNQQDQENRSTERWIGFGLGVLASIIASILLATIKFFYNLKNNPSISQVAVEPQPHTNDVELRSNDERTN